MSSTITLFKTSEKVVIWLHRENKTQVWLGEQLGITRQSVNQKITDNIFTPKDILTLKSLGCPL
jgi:hypothetical protein